MFSSTPEALAVLNQVIDDIQIEEQALDQIVIRKELFDVTGKAMLVKTRSDDDIFYARRKRRLGYYRFVRNREPENTNVFTIIINFDPKYAIYQVSAAHFGEKSHPAPWDRKARPEALPFWQEHALIPDASFAIDYDDVKEFDPDFFKSFEELQERKRHDE